MSRSTGLDAGSISQLSRRRDRRNGKCRLPKRRPRLSEVRYPRAYSRDLAAPICSAPFGGTAGSRRARRRRATRRSSATCAISSGMSVRPGNEHVAQPHRPLERARRSAELDNVLVVHACDALVLLGRERLHVEDDEVDVAQVPRRTAARRMKPLVSIAVWTPMPLTASNSRAAKRSCISGSPPDRVKPPRMALSPLAYLRISSIASSSVHRNAVAQRPGVGVVAILAAEHARRRPRRPGGCRGRRPPSRS